MAQRNTSPFGIRVLDSNKRRSARLDVNGISSACKGKPFGNVNNISVSGVQIFRRKRIRYQEHERFFVLVSCDDLQIEVYVKVAWEKRLGFMKWSYGLSFSDLTERDQMIIKKMAIKAGATNSTFQNQFKVAG